MKLRICIDIEVSSTVAQTIQRSGFMLEPDGTGMKVKVPNTPTIPKRKVKVVYETNPSKNLSDIVSEGAVYK